MLLNVIFKELEQKINVKFYETEQKLNVTFGEFQTLTLSDEYEIYTGYYEVTPKDKEQVYETKQKVMSDNFKVKQIPYFDVSNESGGSTVFIGSEV